ncbi:tautomerase family protein [Aureimonas jatrophae]|uniref:Phenylpyruvate tautomerase PptA, 4-oxalocrotonate tautomerase family n=1 Tax=Aureimonas jatrophae TaxID=1166073 RepID=A0A1H0DFX4_9HYPH|nr:tautomerase family protein [Aureimonas jatrophae]MBB3951870.1 phenylpyruvate tautomerase PptA (4-oxalocrotonate tautomerase family) [Aureimonas jatrophae]SDN69012.1 Phenylpyruvate tautomerase PptA, 4-oxalocrotonate tautomerase family [Aureimonas jatrophae]
MPLVRITLFRGRSPENVRSMADGVHAALVETYGVPEDDRFQIIEQRAPDEIIYNPGYLGIRRTDGIVIVHVVASNWRNTAQKQTFYQAVVDRLAADPGVRREDVQIIISPNDKPDWSFGNGIAPYVSVSADR